MNKSTNFNAIKAQKSAKNLSEIGVYNQTVKNNLSKNDISPILLRSIEIFHNQTKNKKISIEKYNNLVEDFNSRNGMLLLKKGSEYNSGLAPKKYNYINYPYLDRSAVKKTMDNYRKYVFNYNEKVALENQEIKKYNYSVIKETELTKDEKLKKAHFYKANKHLFKRYYNELVEEENTNNAIIPKQRIQKIKYTSELLFNVLVGFYVSQLKNNNAYLLEMNQSTRTLKNALPKLKIDHRKLATHKIANIPRLDICKKTAQNHIKRLREASVLENYRYINQNKPVSVNFNVDILEILDGNQPKSKTTEKQQITLSNDNVLPHNNDYTRTKLKEKEIMDFAKGKGLRKCGSILEKVVSNRRLYKNTKGMKIKNITEPPKNENTLLTKNFKNKLLEDQEFAERLANGDFFEYQGLRYDYLQKVMQYAQISTEQYRQIIIQDIIKSSSKIWKSHTVHVGEWKRTINALKEQLFHYHPNKEVIYKRIFEYRWKLDWARKWFIKHTEVKALYPFNYFDPTRTTKQEVGFAGLHKKWLKHKDYLKNRVLEKKKQVQDSNTRKRKLTAQKKLTNAIKKFEGGKYNYQQLYNYIQDNLPNDYLVSLPSLLKNQNTNLA